jgi:hypothetical protein
MMFDLMIGMRGTRFVCTYICLDIIPAPEREFEYGNISVCVASLYSARYQYCYLN